MYSNTTVYNDELDIIITDKPNYYEEFEIYEEISIRGNISRTELPHEIMLDIYII